MDQQAKDNLKAFVEEILNRRSYLVCANEGKTLTDNEIIAKVMHAQLNVFEERCIKTNRRKAIWTYNRATGKAFLNRLFQSKTANDQFTRKTYKRK